MSTAHLAPAVRVWQRMLSGRRLDLLDPSPVDVEIADIAHGLARVARWNGQTRGEHAFSVAQHSVLVEAIAASLEPGLAPRERLAVLLHDAPEYVIGDMISPFKAVLGGHYGDTERRLAAAIHLRFGLAPSLAARPARLLKRADQTAAFFEATRLAGFDETEAARLFGRPRLAPAEVEALLEAWPPVLAAARFLERFAALDLG